MVTEITYLQGLANISSTGSYILMNNLDFNSDSSYDKSDIDWQTKKTAWTTGEGWSPIRLTEGGGNYGSFDGGGFTISNLFINRPTTDSIGLFGSVDWCTIKNIGLLDVNITGKDSVGALCGWSESVISIEQCYSTGSVTGTNYVGGLLGVCEANNISEEDGKLGVKNCYSWCDVTGTQSIGGFSGTGGVSYLKNCYSIGEVTGTTYTGGFVGENSSSTYDKCFYDKTTSGQTGDTKGVGKTTEEMKTESTFIGWDTPPWYFWTNDYPRLSEQIFPNVSGKIQMGYFYDISGTTSEVKTLILNNKLNKALGYVVGSDGTRYILTRL